MSCKISDLTGPTECGKGGISTIILYGKNDVVLDKKTGEIRVKRKYGKFKRDFYIIYGNEQSNQKKGS